LEFSRQYAADGWDVVATCRNPHDAIELNALGKTVLQLDVADDRSIDGFLHAVAGIPIDIVIANAGIGSGPAQPAAAVTREAWVQAMVVNTLAPLRLATGLRSNLQKGWHKKAVAISSLAASIARYDVPGQYAYRASKAALNSLWRSLSIEWRAVGIVCIVLRPGRVRTRMTGFTGDLSPEESVEGMRRVIASATIAESGQFIGYDGNEVPW
jgi:NAD(P)-dependent dehydrogenase (short-subunit alcohol dehydrogenase family)